MSGMRRVAGGSLARAVCMLLAAVVFSAGSGLAEKRRPFPSAFTDQPLLGTSTTASQKGIFAPFLASTCIVADCSAGDLNTAISISNTLSGPPGIDETFQDLFGNFEGTVEIFLWDTYGHMLFYETQAGSPGIGLTQAPDQEGFLLPGQTWRVLLSQILAEVDYTQHEIDFGHVEGVFAGYIWVVANFDGVQGTTNLTDFATFTQSLVFQPDLGSTFFDFDGNAGVPLVPPPPQEP